MDVRCERCSTEYEFDDALVSGRGTTVKCTTCGYKFKIRRSDADFSEDFWNVHTGDGRTLVFTSLRELQRAIQTNMVDRNDLLSRGGLREKSIAQIPELAPFFEERDQRRSAPPTTAGTPNASVRSTGSADLRLSSRPPPPPGALAPPLVAPPRQRVSTRPDFPPAPPAAAERDRAGQPVWGRGQKTLIGTGSHDDSIAIPLPKPPPPDAAALPAAPPVREHVARSGLSEGPSPAAPTVEVDARRSLPPPAPPVAGGPTGTSRPPLTTTQPIDPAIVPKSQAFAAFTNLTPAPRPIEAPSRFSPQGPPASPAMNLAPDETSESMRERALSLSAGPSSNGGRGRRRSVGAYTVAIVAAGVVVIGALWAKGNLGGLLGRRPPPAVAADARVATLLASGEKALAEGSFDAAKESFDEALVLANREPRVMLALARLAATRADVPWLKSRLIAADATDEGRLTAADLKERSAEALAAAAAALAVAPADPAALRARVDALRISGDRVGARALAGQVAPLALQAETAYVLATLDLADNEPLWSSVIERLRVAASAESGPGRARALLAYALARSGDISGAKAEIERLAALSRSHPLVPLLRRFADRAKPPPDHAGPGDGGLMAAVHGLDGGRGRGPVDRSKVPSDARQLVAQGEAERAKGDFDRAQTLFAAALDRNPSDTEALNGLAAIAHSRHDLNGARATYKRVLSANPSYVPALVGVGDVDWELGDRASAMKTYKEVVDRFPEGSYPARIKQRVAGGSASAPAPAPVDTGGGG